jgi:hypothetical protein
MDVEQVARAVVYMASLPLDANVPFLTVMATKIPFVGEGPIRDRRMARKAPASPARASGGLRPTRRARKQLGPGRAVP